MRNLTFYMSLPNRLIQHMFEMRGSVPVSTPEKADVIVFGGGEDVDPSFYGEKPHPTTYSNIERDKEESTLFNRFPHIFKIGICRGAQFLNVMSGGSLWQDVDNHALMGTHEVEYNDPIVGAVGGLLVRRYNVTSTHHQMMKPHPFAQVWGLCSFSRCTYKDSGVDRKRMVLMANPGADPEIVWIKQSNSLCFQPHPEFMDARPTRELFWKCVERAIRYVPARNILGG